MTISNNKHPSRWRIINVTRFPDFNDKNFLNIFFQVAGRSERKNSKICLRPGTRGKLSSTARFHSSETEISTVLTSIGNIPRAETTKKITSFYSKVCQTTQENIKADTFGLLLRIFFVPVIHVNYFRYIISSNKAAKEPRFIYFFFCCFRSSSKLHRLTVFLDLVICFFFFLQGAHPSFPLSPSRSFPNLVCNFIF